MNREEAEAARRELDQRFAALNRRSLKPPGGSWIRATRDALRMSSSQLGRRLGLTQPSISFYERSEREANLGLDTLRRAADAMDCDVVYAIVPRTSLEDVVHSRSIEKARRLIKEKAVEGKDLEELAAELRQKPNLWADKPRFAIERSPDFLTSGGKRPYNRRK